MVCLLLFYLILIIKELILKNQTFRKKFTLKLLIFEYCISPQSIKNQMVNPQYDPGMILILFLPPCSSTHFGEVHTVFAMTPGFALNVPVKHFLLETSTIFIRSSITNLKSMNSLSENI